MKALILLTLLLSGCESLGCHQEYDTSRDDGKCWRECTMAAAASRYFDWNFRSCINTACNYPTPKQVCK